MSHVPIKIWKYKPCLEEREGSWYKKVNHHLQLSYMYFTPSGLKNELHNNIYFLSVFFFPAVCVCCIVQDWPTWKFPVTARGLKSTFFGWLCRLFRFVTKFIKIQTWELPPNWLNTKRTPLKTLEEVMDSKANAKVSTDGQTGRRLKRIAILVLEILLV